MLERDRMKVLNDITLILANLVPWLKNKSQGSMEASAPSHQRNGWTRIFGNVKSISWMASGESLLGDVGIFAKCASWKHFAKPINRKTAPIYGADQYKQHGSNRDFSKKTLPEEGCLKNKPVLCSALSNSLFSFSLSLKHPRLFIACKKYNLFIIQF